MHVLLNYLTDSFQQCSDDAFGGFGRRRRRAAEMTKADLDSDFEILDASVQVLLPGEEETILSGKEHSVA